MQKFGNILYLVATMLVTWVFFSIKIDLFLAPLFGHCGKQAGIRAIISASALFVPPLLLSISFLANDQNSLLSLLKVLAHYPILLLTPCYSVVTYETNSNGEIMVSRRGTFINYIVHILGAAICGPFVVEFASFDGFLVQYLTSLLVVLLPMVVAGAFPLFLIQQCCLSCCCCCSCCKLSVGVLRISNMDTQ